MYGDMIEEVLKMLEYMRKGLYCPPCKRIRNDYLQFSDGSKRYLD